MHRAFTPWFVLSTPARVIFRRLRAFVGKIALISRDQRVVEDARFEPPRDTTTDRTAAARAFTLPFPNGESPTKSWAEQVGSTTA